MIPRFMHCVFLPLADNRIGKLRQAEAPRLPLAAPDGMGGDLPRPGHLQHATAGDAKEFCGSVGVCKGLSVRKTAILKITLFHRRVSVTGESSAGEYSRHLTSLQEPLRSSRGML